MAFTTDLTTDIGKLRLEIGDAVVEPGGVLPSGANLTDEQIQVWLTREGTAGTQAAVMRATASALESLSRIYAGSVDMRMGPRSESLSQKSLAYARLAAALRAIWGDSPDAPVDGGGPGVLVMEGDKTLNIDFISVWGDEWA